MKQNLSAYVLTKNSEKHLALVLERLERVADEIIILDSGSIDKTSEIVKNFSKAQFIFRSFNDFTSQRNFAAAMCRHPWVLFVDSDEVLDEEAVVAINELKLNGFGHDAYRIRRDWVVLGKSIHALYPIISPDYPIRLFNKNITSFQSGSRRVHETPRGYKDCGVIPGKLSHFTFASTREISHKLQHYTDLASRDIFEKKRSITYSKFLFSPIGAWIKYYFIKGGYRDGRVGLVLAKYAYDYVKMKYAKALKLKYIGEKS